MDDDFPAIPRPSAAGARPPDDVRRGIALILASGFLFSIMNATIKWLSHDIPPVEIGFFRQFFSMIPLSILVAHRGGWSALRTRRPFGHLFRGLIGNLTMIPYMFSFALLPLADATALTFAAPLFITGLSVPLLGEAVGLHRWSAVAVGFVGVLVMTNPTGAMFASGTGAGAGLGVLAAFLSALMMVTIRQLSRTEHTVTIVFYFALIGCVVFGAVLPFVWVRPIGFEWVGLVGMGLVGGGSQFVMTHAYRFAPAAALAPFSYLTILWGTLFGYAIWDQLPRPRMLAGSAIVIASGLYIFYRETRRHARLRSLPVAADQAS